jgi:hypothetical protein
MISHAYRHSDAFSYSNKSLHYLNQDKHIYILGCTPGKMHWSECWARECWARECWHASAECQHASDETAKWWSDARVRWYTLQS